MDIPLNPDIEKLVSRQVQLGRFRTAADVIQSAVLLLVEREVLVRTLPSNETGHEPSARRSPRGLLADIRSDIDADEVKDARQAMWAGFLHGEA